MRDEEEWERRLLETGRQPRRIDEVRAAASRSRSNRSKTAEIVGKIIVVIAATLIVLCTLAVAAAIIGGTFWLLTGEPIF